MEEGLAISQTPSLLLEAMRRPVRRRRTREKLVRRAIDGKHGERPKRERIPPPSTDFPHNNYLAECPSTVEPGLPGRSAAKPGAPFGNRNAVKPGLAELRTLKAEVKAHVSRMKAAIAAAEALIAARKPARRIDCFIYEVDGVVRRVWAVTRIRKCVPVRLELAALQQNRLNPPSRGG